MAKGKKVPKSPTIQALEFLCLVGSSAEERHSYCLMQQNFAAAFNGLLAAGTQIEEDLDACPHLDMLLAALERTGPEYVITQLSPEKLKVEAGTFQAFIPCLSPGVLPWPVPDAPVCVIDDRLKDALKKVVPLLSVKAETVLEQSIQLNSGSCVATDRSIILEAWHGIDMPSGLLIPKPIVTAINKAKKPLKQFGYSKATATFYFEDGTWLRTQLFQDQWPPAIRSIFNVQVNPRKVPPHLFEAANKVAPFSFGRVFIKDGLISSHPFDAVQEGSSLTMPIGSEHKERSYSYDNLKFVSRFAEEWDEEARQDATYFTGDGTRGLVGHSIPESNSSLGPVTDEDIPF